MTNARSSHDKAISTQLSLREHPAASNSSCPRKPPHFIFTAVASRSSGVTQIRGCRWRDPAYLRRALGHRTVPVEVGEHYLAEGWGQRLLPFAEFWDACVAADRPGDTTTVAGDSAARDVDPRASRGVSRERQADQEPHSGKAGGERSTGHRGDVQTHSAGVHAGSKRRREAHACDEGMDCEGSAPVAERGADGGAPGKAAGLGQQQIMYLAQHQLFDQVPALHADIMVRPTA
jgi:hypothetical protein